MRKVFLLAVFVLSVRNPSGGQVLTNSNLPIIVISTDQGAAIPDYPKIPASMKIISRGPGQRNYVADQDNPDYLNYSGRITIETRGSSSQSTEKKQYSFSTKQADKITNNNVSLLDMPAENDWILNGMVFDPAMIRDYLSYNLSRQIGQYASRTAYCELILNGIYKGLYLLQEKIKADDNRVNVVKIGFTDNTLPDVSGGYITKADKNTGDDPIAWTMNSPNNASVGYIHALPVPESVTPAQNNYIRDQFIQLEATANNSNIANGYPSVIDIPSFVDFILINELASNADAYMYSTFFHKDRIGKLRAGPIWDLDLTYGNDLFFWGFDRSKTNIWQFSNYDNEGSRFWFDLFNNADFRCYLSRRWHGLTGPGQPLNPDSLESFINQTVTVTSEAYARNKALWGTAGSQSQHIANIKTWITVRMNWITENLGSFTACEHIDVPPLVITRIMYHPLPSADFPEESDHEFIEITNSGDQPVDLTGVYFSNPGLSYQFPVNATLGPGRSLVLAGNASVFQSRHGIAPFGEYARQLSNKSENLVLADGFGNIIDSVWYQDTIPWPGADGNGYYLQLSEPGLDNALAENWTVSNEVFVSDRGIPGQMDLRLYPNPVQDVLSIRAGAEIIMISLSDIQGRLLISVAAGRESYELDMSRFSSGTYIIRIITTDRTYTQKIIRD
jgi:hypothetical protein